MQLLIGLGAYGLDTFRMVAAHAEEHRGEVRLLLCDCAKHESECPLMVLVRKGSVDHYEDGRPLMTALHIYDSTSVSKTCGRPLMMAV